MDLHTSCRGMPRRRFLMLRPLAQLPLGHRRCSPRPNSLPPRRSQCKVAAQQRRDIRLPMMPFGHRCPASLRSPSSATLPRVDNRARSLHSMEVQGCRDQPTADSAGLQKQHCADGYCSSLSERVQFRAGRAIAVVHGPPVHGSDTFKRRSSVQVDGIASGGQHGVRLAHLEHFASLATF